MDLLTKKRDAALKTTKNLKVATIRFSTLPESVEDYLLIRDGLVKRFELATEAYWKFLRAYIEEKHGTLVKPPSPKETLRTALQLGLLNAEEEKYCSGMLNTRNLAVHVYDGDFADSLIKALLEHADLFATIVDRL